jgi:hypothetical protein
MMLLVQAVGGGPAQTNLAPPPPDTISFNQFFAKVSVEGLEFSATLKALGGKY